MGTFTVWAGTKRVAAGSLPEVAVGAKKSFDHGRLPILVLDERGEPVELDLRGTPQEVAARFEETGLSASLEPRGAGRPKLGVVGREVTLLPRHWDWLNAQPGGASVTIRRLVEDARRSNRQRDEQRQSVEAAYRFMRTLAGNEAGFEEATRALFAHNRERFEEETASWPPDVRDHARQLAAASFQA